MEEGIKEKLYKACEQNTLQRLETIEKRLAAIAESRNNETKSSAGDKFETGRAMMQMEEEKAKAQLQQIRQVQFLLSKLDISSKKLSIGPGSLVYTDQGNYFIAIGIGKIKIGPQLYYSISPQAPIGQQLLGKKIGESIFFNGKEIKILEVN